MKRKLLIFFVLLNLLIAQSLAYTSRTLAFTCCPNKIGNTECSNISTKTECDASSDICLPWRCPFDTEIVPPAGCVLPNLTANSCSGTGKPYSCNNSSNVPQYCCDSSSVCTNNGLTAVSVGNPNPAAPVPGIVWGKWYSPTVAEFYAKVYGSPDQEIFGERYTFAQVVWIINSLSLLFQLDLMSQESVQKIQQFFTLIQDGTVPQLADFKVFGINGLIIGSMSELYTHPAGSGIQYIASGLQKYNIVQPVLAQGYGYTNSTVVQPLWTASRNICYFLMVILLIAAGFMIMFRVKVNAQTAVSIQVMIPKIIITLLLITFSYAIAGLIIDLIYLVLTLCLSMLRAVSPSVVGDLGNAVKFFTGSYWNVVGYYFAAMISQTLGMTVLSAFLTVPGIGVILGLVLSIVVGLILLKIWWMLMKTYVSILLGFVLAPWQILLGLVPGSKGGFSSWLKSMIANASVFVITPLMFLFSVYLYNPLSWGLSNAVDLTWLSDLVSTFLTGVNQFPSDGKAAAMPLFGSGSGLTGTFGFFLSLAILALIPKAAEAVKKALSVASFAYGSAFGEAIGTVGSVAGSETFSRRVTKPIAGFTGMSEFKTDQAVKAAGRGADWIKQQISEK